MKSQNYPASITLPTPKIYNLVWFRGPYYEWDIIINKKIQHKRDGKQREEQKAVDRGWKKKKGVDSNTKVETWKALQLLLLIQSYKGREWKDINKQIKRKKEEKSLLISCELVLTPNFKISPQELFVLVSWMVFF